MRNASVWVYVGWLVGLLGCGSGSGGAATDAGAIDGGDPASAECSTLFDCDEQLICSAEGVCAPATCGDLVVTGNETDIDCGGDCAPCQEGQLCATAFDCASLYCDAGDTSAVCRDCTSNDDCAEVSGTFCAAGRCIGQEALGTSCESSNQCGSGYCIDGVCCDGPCGGLCESCGDDGICRPVSAGTVAEAGECPTTSDCGNAGTCDGSGGCTLVAASTACATESCAGGGSGTCDGAGVCVGGAGSCNPYTCNTGIDDCYSTCSPAGNSAQCASGHYCNGSACVAKKSGTNQTCSAGYECTSGYCVDGYCCNGPCNATCQGCSQATTGNTGVANGQCTNILAAQGQVPSDCDPNAGGTCGNTGRCNGAGSCEQEPATTQCAGASCSAGSLTPPRYCSGGGTCASQSPAACPNGFGCASASACNTSCSSSAECQSGLFCYTSSCGPDDPCLYCYQLYAACSADPYTCMYYYWNEIQACQSMGC